MKTLLAKTCNACPLCKYARKKPENLMGKIMHWHGKWCPAWKAREEIYGQVPEARAAVKETEPMTAAFFSTKGPFSQINDAFGKLYAWMGERGYETAGPPLGIYYNAPGEVPDEELAWEVLSPISGDIETADPDEQGLGVKKLEATRAASITHRGPYQNLSKVYEELTAWIKDNGLEITGPPREVYLNNPAETPAEALLTEISFPVKET